MMDISSYDRLMEKWLGGGRPGMAIIGPDFLTMLEGLGAPIKPEWRNGIVVIDDEIYPLNP